MAHLERGGLYFCETQTSSKTWNNFKYWETLFLNVSICHYLLTIMEIGQ